MHNNVPRVGKYMLFLAEGQTVVKPTEECCFFVFESQLNIINLLKYMFPYLLYSSCYPTYIRIKHYTFTLLFLQIYDAGSNHEVRAMGRLVTS